MPAEGSGLTRTPAGLVGDFILGGDSKPKVTASIKIVPAVDSKDIHGVIDKAIEHISKWGMKYEVGPSNTTVEGEYEVILDKLKELGKYMGSLVDRFVMIVDFDYKKGGISIDEKVSKYR